MGAMTHVRERRRARFGPRSSGAPGRWGRELVARGYVVLIPDSFTSRGHPDGVCTDPSRSRTAVGPARRMVDAYAALAHARSLPFVDGGRVAVMGGYSSTRSA